MTLTEFLTARLDEWEDVACKATPGPWEASAYDAGLSYRCLNVSVVTEAMGDKVADADYNGDAEGPHGDEGADAAHIAFNDPAFVLAQVAAIRAVMALHASDGGRPPECETCAYEAHSDYPEGWIASYVREDWPCKTLRALAQPWASHPDYPR